MSKLGWGILSTGRIVDWFCGDFHKVEDGELRAVCSRSIENARAFGEQYNIDATYDDYAAMLADPNVDVVYIGTPHTLHFDNAAQALRAGKSVLCEKPMTVGAAESRKLLDIAEETGGYLMEAMWTYFLPAMQKAKSWVDEGRIGDLVHIKTDFGYPVPYDPKLREYDAELAGGCLLEMGIYPIAIANLFAGREPNKIHAVGRRAANGVEDDVTATFEYGDFTGSIGTSFRARLRNAAYIIGTESYIVIPDAFRCSEAYLYKIEDLVDHFIAHRKTRGYEYQVIAMCEDIRAGRTQSPVMPLTNSLSFQNQIDAIKAQLPAD